MDNIKKLSSIKKIYPSKKYTYEGVARILWKMKYFIILSLFISLILTIMFNEFVPPVYQSSVLLKKEKRSENSPNDEFKDILLIQTQDEIETELELIKTTNVINMVIKELNLSLSINYAEISRNKYEINKWLIDYRNEYLNNNSIFNFPNISFTEYYNVPYTKKYYLKSGKSNNVLLYDAENNVLLQKSSNQDSAVFYVPNRMVVRWKNAAPNSKIGFTIENYTSLFNRIKNSISVNRKIKTDVFEVIVNGPTPYSTEQIAKVLTNKYIDTRLEQQRQGVRYSFRFIDEQLNEFTEKLKKAQDDLSNFKASGKITSLNDNASNIVSFLSNLQAEKIKTDLETAEYNSRATSLQNQLKSNQYIDQTYLSPEKMDQANSPFSALLRQLSELEIQRIELLKKRKESHPDVINLDQQIAGLKDQLKSYNKNTITAYEIILNALNKKNNDINKLIASYENKIQMFPGQEMRLANLMRQKDAYEKIFTMLLNKREEMRIAELSTLQDIIIVDPPHRSLIPVSPNKVINLIAGFILGILIGLLGVVIKEFWKNRFIQVEEVENDFTFPLLSIIPRYSRQIAHTIKSSNAIEDKIVMLSNNSDGFKESYRVLKTKILAKLNSKIIMVTSCEEGAGKTTIAANLAVAFALSNKKVLLVDADLRRSRLTEMLEIPKGTPGLITLLTQNNGTLPFQSIKFKDKFDIPRCIQLIPSGGNSENSGNLIGSDKMDKLINTLNSSPYDIIIFDTPPITRVVDSLELCKYIKEVLIVLRSGKTMKEALIGGITELDQTDVKIIGTIMNDCQVEDTNFKYRYGYGYGYG